MKQRFLSVFFFLISLFFTAQGYAAKQLELLWQMDNLPTPESVLYVADKKSPYLFVSLIDGAGNLVDGKGGIAKLTSTGDVIDGEWITGLNAPKGMALYEGRLYVADITELVVIDVKRKKVIEKIPVVDAVFLNDVSVNSSGIVYVSDTRTHKVHRLINGKIELYLDNVTNANGLVALGSSLVVAAGQELLLIDANKNRLVIAKGFKSAIDGIVVSGRGEFIVSCWVGLIYYVHGDGNIELLVDSRNQQINTADMGYDQQNKHLYVPNFNSNTVTGYLVN